MGVSLLAHPDLSRPQASLPEPPFSERSAVFDPSTDRTAEEHLRTFRDDEEELPSSFAASELEQSIREDISFEPLSNGLDLFRSLAEFEGTRGRSASASIDKILKEEPGNSRIALEAKLLGALECFSRMPLRQRDVRSGVALLESIPATGEVPHEIAGEIYFWRAEGYRALGLMQRAIDDYNRTLSVGPTNRLRGLTLFRRAELEEHESELLEAEEDFLAARETAPSPVRLLASLRRAAVLRSMGEYSRVIDELDSTDSLDRVFEKSYQLSARDFDDHSDLVQSMELKPPIDERLVETETRTDGFSTPAETRTALDSNVQLASPFLASEIGLLRGSALGELGMYDSAAVILQAAELRIRSLPDSSNSLFTHEQRNFLLDAIDFERGWALFKRRKYDSASVLFLKLAVADTVQRRILRRDANLSLRDQGFYGDPFYQEFNDLKVATIDSAILDHENIDTAFFIYNDFPERSRFYAGVCLARSGKYAEAEQVFSALVQDKSDIYSSRAEYFLGLVRFIRHNPIEAASILEPLSSDASLSGRFSSLLMGEITYRKNEFEASQLFFRTAINGLPDSLKSLKAEASLERGLSLIPIGAWGEARIELERYLTLHGNVRPRTDDSIRYIEAVFWHGKALYRLGSLDSARSEFANILLRFPNSSRAIDAEYDYAWTLFRNNEFKRAEPVFEKVIDMDSMTRYSYDALARAGDCYFAIGDYADALDIYNEAVDRPAFNDYRTTRALFQLGITRLHADSSRSAMNEFHTLEKKFPNSDLLDRAYFNDALAAFEINHQNEAESDVDRLVASYPSSTYTPRGLLIAADERVNSDEYEPSLRFYRKIIEGYPTSPEIEPALFGYEDALVKLKRVPEAIAAGDTFIARQPKSSIVPEVIFRRGELEFNAGMATKSMGTMQDFIEKYPKHSDVAQARIYIGKNEAVLKDTASALEQFELVQHDYPNDDAANAEAWLEIGRIYRGQHQNAIASGAYLHAMDMKYYSTDAAPVALQEYAEYLVQRSMRDSAIIVLRMLRNRYSLETSAGARAELRVADLYAESGKSEQEAAALKNVAAARHDALGGLARIKLGELDMRGSAWKSALGEFESAKTAYTLTDELEVRRLFGVAEASVKLNRKPQALAALHTLVNEYDLTAHQSQHAKEMIDLLTPKKKTARHAKKGAKRR